MIPIYIFDMAPSNGITLQCFVAMVAAAFAVHSGGSHAPGDLRHP